MNYPNSTRPSITTPKLSNWIQPAPKPSTTEDWPINPLREMTRLKVILKTQ